MDEKLQLLYDYFNQFEGSEEFYVGDIKRLIEEADKEELKLIEE